MNVDAYRNISTNEAKKLQHKLCSQVEISALTHDVTTVAGADISFDRGSDMMHAAIIVLKLPDLQPVARSLTSVETSFPYIPGLLAFRELPVLYKAWEQLNEKPDVLILDGHGLAHPRRMGIATHFGIEIDYPTIGCAKNILTGNYEVLGDEKGAYAPLKDDGEKVGIVLRSRTNVNPIYISPGHKTSFDNAYSVVMKTLTKYKLPRTTRLAHQWANKLRRGEVGQGYYSA